VKRCPAGAFKKADKLFISMDIESFNALKASGRFSFGSFSGIDCAFTEEAATQNNIQTATVFIIPDFKKCFIYREF
jgi:hypothetical protein